MMYDYNIAQLIIRSEVDIVEAGLRGFKPFEVDYDPQIKADCILLMSHSIKAEEYNVVAHLSDFWVAEANADCTLARTDNGYIYSIKRRESDSQPTFFHIDNATHMIETNMVCSSTIDVSLLRFGLWIMFGIVISKKEAIAIHSSVIVSQNRGVLFLGESGTGKSTHTRLWRENIIGTTLLNDDSPIVRIIDNQALVFGSPWSGKTPCYKNQSYPIAGFCRLSQAPYNAIRRLPTIAAIGALLPSCPPAFAHDEYLQDCTCTTLGKLLKLVPTYHLECLPNAEAAELSYATIIGNGK